MRSAIRLLALTGLVLVAALLAWAATTTYTQGFDTGHGWTYTQLTCNVTGCTNGDAADGQTNTTSVFAKAASTQPGNRTTTGYFSKAFTWENLGVPPGDTVTTVDGSWYSRRVNTGGGCTTSSTAGMQIFDSANTTEATASAVEPAIDVSGDAAWTSHNPTGAIAVLAANQASSTTVRLRFNLNPAVNGNGNACELRGDEYKLTIVSTGSGATPRRKPIVTTYVFSVPGMR
jgi:hypothetical protein